MAALYALELIVSVALGLLVCFEVLIPLWRNEPVFPIFRKKRTEAEKALAGAHEDVEISRLMKEIHDSMKEAEQIKKSTEDQKGEEK